jgi:hypothetical protein
MAKTIPGIVEERPTLRFTIMIDNQEPHADAGVAYFSEAKEIRLAAYPEIPTGCHLGVALSIVLIKMQAES